MTVACRFLAAGGLEAADAELMAMSMDATTSTPTMERILNRVDLFFILIDFLSDSRPPRE
jgi:hypothetical protein